jgi:RNA polymerase sigma factor (sigma-70 family)
VDGTREIYVPEKLRSDAELTRRHLLGDASAFEALANRHAPMVYRACLRLLGDAHEAEDATQAVFVILARKASRFRKGGDLAAWLHGISRRVASEARRAGARRRRREEEGAMLKAASSGGGISNQERAAALEALDREVGALPARERQAVVLRYLEGRSVEEAAAIAECPEGTLKWRASEGLNRLRSRLGGRGAMLGTAALAALLESEAAATLPASLVPSVVTASKLAVAAGATAGAGAVGAKAILLAEGTMKAMMLFKIKVAAAVLGATLIAGASVPVGKKLIAAAETPTPTIEVKDKRIRCKVTKLLSGGKVLLSAGSAQGVKPGFEFDVTRGKMKLGAVRAKDVSANQTTAEVISFRQAIKVGDQASTRFAVVTPATQPGGSGPKATPGKIAWGKAVNGLQAGLVPLGNDAKPSTAFTVVSGLARHLNAGKSVVAALAEIAKKGGSVADAAKRMEKDIRAGTSLSEAMAAQPKAFDAACVKAVRKGETSRRLDQALARLSSSLAAEGRSGEIKWGRPFVCPACPVNFRRNILGKCTDCKGSTASNRYKLCASCAAKKRVCQACGRAKPRGATFAAGREMRFEMHLRNTDGKGLEVADPSPAGRTWTILFTPKGGGRKRWACFSPEKTIIGATAWAPIRVPKNGIKTLALRLNRNWIFPLVGPGKREPGPSPRQLPPGRYLVTVRYGWPSGNVRPSAAALKRFYSGAVSTAPVEIEVKAGGARAGAPDEATARRLTLEWIKKEKRDETWKKVNAGKPITGDQIIVRPGFKRWRETHWQVTIRFKKGGVFGFSMEKKTGRIILPVD